MPPNEQRPIARARRLRSNNTSSLQSSPSPVKSEAPADPLGIEAIVDRVFERRFDELLEALGTRTLPKYIGRGELGQMLGVSPPVIRRLESEGIPCVRLGEVIRYPLDAVTAWLESRESQRDAGQ
jgi:hypothetical protein